MNDIMNSTMNDMSSSTPQDINIPIASEIQHSARAHARLNASSSHRWMMCPPSVKLSEQFVDKPSAYAEEGTYTDIYKTTLLGVGDLERRMGRKRFNEVLGKYIVKPAGAPTLVPETDPRKPYLLKSIRS